MRDDMQLYFNPACSKCRGALDLLSGHNVEVVEYLETPPSIEALRRLLILLQLSARELIRTGEPEYTALGLADVSLDDEALLAAMHAHPRLIERPIFVRGGRAVIGRPPERVLELLEDAPGEGSGSC